MEKESTDHFADHERFKTMRETLTERGEREREVFVSSSRNEEVGFRVGKEIETAFRRLFGWTSNRKEHQSIGSRCNDQQKMIDVAAAASKELLLFEGTWCRLSSSDDSRDLVCQNEKKAVRKDWEHRGTYDRMMIDDRGGPGLRGENVLEATKMS